MNLETDFSYADPGEKQSYSIDFVNDMRAGDSIISGIWDVEVVSTETGSVVDATPELRLLGGAATLPETPTITSQFLQDLQPGNRYRVQAVVTTFLGEVISNYTHVACRALA